jgi:hypothetical protein
LPLLTSTVRQCNTTMEEVQQDHSRLWQTIGNIHNHVMPPTNPPTPVVMGTTPTVGSGACDQPRNIVSVGCDEEAGAPGGLRQPPCNSRTGFDEETSESTHVWHLSPREPVPSGCESGLAAKEFVSFGCGDGINAPWDMGNTATDIRSNLHHPLFPQVDPSTFNNLA